MYIYIAKCGKWDYGGLKMWEVGLWGSKTVGSGTLGSKKCGKWDFQDAVSPPPRIIGSLEEMCPSFE